jgi:hypothetical protein
VAHAFAEGMEKCGTFAEYKLIKIKYISSN